MAETLREGDEDSDETFWKRFRSGCERFQEFGYVAAAVTALVGADNTRSYLYQEKPHVSISPEGKCRASEVSTVEVRRQLSFLEKQGVFFDRAEGEREFLGSVGAMESVQGHSFQMTEPPRIVSPQEPGALVAQFKAQVECSSAEATDKPAQ